ncbi:MAG: SDR family NAD(P)-dependent oxidoreductase, partial [Betaproteobacteria bacterium]|nr:SDR family NAD(P)-dependent oxidoreductase [Betaproteobacteria bacterium]
MLPTTASVCQRSRRLRRRRQSRITFRSVQVMAELDEFLKRVSHPGVAVSERLFTAMRGQASKTPICPETPYLDGRRTLVTGGNAGIGYWIAQGLSMRGASVMISARREAQLRNATESIGKETRNLVEYTPLDLADLRSVSEAAVKITRAAKEDPFDIVVLNAGIWPKKYARSAQGHEIAFAVNVLGHHALLKRLLARGMIATDARIVVLTGDIYVMARECTPDFKYSGAYGGMLAYCRSKLGNLWFAAEFAKRHPLLEVVVVHPGVVASGLVSGEHGILSTLNRGFLLSPKMGAQTPLVAATQPGLGRAIYLHNTAGHMK